ncbi:MAG: hypothetical protein Q8S01_08810, partial [Ignavibacteria bacterium]|nr:hypothetical protein [Ignavibacteria bacterium]
MFYLLMGFSGDRSTKVDPLLWFDAAFRIEKVNSSFDANDGQNYLVDDLVPKDSSTAKNDLSISLTNAVSDSNETPKSADSLQINFNSVTSLPLFNPMMDSNKEVKLLDSIKTFPATTAKGKKTTVATDSLALQTEIARLDSIRLDSLQRDSTARISQFKYKRKDSPVLSLYDKKPTKLFAQPSSGVRRRVVEIDSTGKNVEIREKVGDVTTKIILTIPLEEYVELRLKTRQEEMWDAIAYQYELKDGKRGLGELIKDITDFEIPLPSVGILSIFGPPKINLRIGGAVDIHGAWRNETTEGVTASRLGNTRNEPDFKQTVQINVNGTIGDKLTISADWNTERTFEYENQLKIKYTGYEDEIVQSVEA